MDITQITQQLTEIHNQAKLWHWQTPKYEEHKALGDFYDSAGGLIDEFVEVYAGKYQRPGAFTTSLVDYKEGAPLTYFKKVTNLLNSPTVRGGLETDLQNILDEMMALSSKTAYLLTLK